METIEELITVLSDEAGVYRPMLNEVLQNGWTRQEAVQLLKSELADTYDFDFTGLCDQDVFAAVFDVLDASEGDESERGLEF